MKNPIIKTFISLFFVLSFIGANSQTKNLPVTHVNGNESVKIEGYEQIISANEKNAFTINPDNNVKFTASKSVKLNPGFSAKAGSRFVANINKGHHLSLKISDPSEDETSNFLYYDIYPNPNKGTFYINLSKLSDNIYIEIYNSLGMLIQSQNLTDYNTSINISNQQPGVYLVKIISGKHIYTEKVILN